MKLPPTTIQGLSGLATYLQQESRKLRQTSMVLISSQQHRADILRPAVDQTVRQVQFMLHQRFNFRVAPVHVLSGILDDTTKVVEVAKRVRARTAVAVGSGNAMDAAKLLHGVVDRIIYVPATYGASMVSYAKNALKVNGGSGEIEVVEPATTDPEDIVHHVLLEEKDFDTESSEIAIAAGLALACDANEEPSSVPLTHMERYEFMTNVGSQLLSYGLKEGKPRSKTLAIATALQSTAFPTFTLMEIMASMLLACDHHIDEQHLKRIPLNLSTRPWEELQAALQENRATWNCWDVSDEEFRAFLSKKHLL